jgi:hypothetical protein
MEAASEARMLVAEQGGDMVLPRLAMIKALYPG